LPSRFKRLLVLGRLALVGLIPSLLIPATSAAVTISLVPDRPPTIAIGETINIGVFMVLDAADQAVGIASTTFHLELGSAFVTGAVIVEVAIDLECVRTGDRETDATTPSAVQTRRECLRPRGGSRG